MRKKITNMMFDKVWKRVLIIFIVIFLLVLGAGIFSINYLNDIASNQSVHSETVTVVDKLYGDNPYSDYYIVLGDNNKTYGITNHDGYGQRMFDAIQVGHKYEFIVKEPLLTDINQQTHILRVKNATG